MPSLYDLTAVKRDRNFSRHAFLRLEGCREWGAIVEERVHVVPQKRRSCDIKLPGYDKTEERDGPSLVIDAENRSLYGRRGLYQTFGTEAIGQAQSGEGLLFETDKLRAGRVLLLHLVGEDEITSVG